MTSYFVFLPVVENFSFTPYWSLNLSTLLNVTTKMMNTKAIIFKFYYKQANICKRRLSWQFNCVNLFGLFIIFLFCLRNIHSERIIGAMLIQLDLEHVMTKENVLQRLCAMHMPNRYLKEHRVFLIYRYLTGHRTLLTHD